MDGVLSCYPMDLCKTERALKESQIFKEFYENFSFKDELKDSINILNSGKGYRAQFIAILGDIYQLKSNEIITLQDVTESLHTATLVHDDVIDNADLRRGYKSFSSVIQNKKSVLLGDYYLALTIGRLAGLENPKLNKYVSETLEQLVEAEWLQASLDTNSWNKEQYEKIAIGKTGSLFSWCLKATTELACNELVTDLPDKIGNELGLMFQIADDCLDFSSTSKTRAADLENQNINYLFVRYPQFKGIDLSQSTSDYQNCLREVAIILQQKLVDTVERFDLLTNQIQAKGRKTRPDASEKFREFCKAIVDQVNKRIRP